MAYSTNTLTGPATQDLFDALVTFMTGNGWTVIDTIAADDKVLSSSGTSGKLKLFIRLMVNSAAASPFTWLGNPHRAISNILVIGYSYWDTGTHTGKDEYSTWGPWIEITSLTGEVSRTTKMKADGTGTPLAATKTSHWNSWATTNSGARGTPGSNWLFHNKYRHVWNQRDVLSADASIRARNWFDNSLARNSDDFDVGFQRASNNNMQSHSPAWVYNKAADTEHFYGLADTSPIAATWLRYNVSTNTTTTLAQPPWATVNASGGASVWDGDDNIYVLCGENTQNFAKYTISTNSWTSLASTGINRSLDTNCQPHMIYLPISAQPGGATEDIIITKLAYGNTTISKYNVTSNTWSGTYTLPANFDAGDYFWWNGRDRILFHDVGTGNIYASIPTTNPGTFANLGALGSGVSNPRACEIFDHHVSLIRGTLEPLLPLKYWFLGDADGVAIVTAIAGNYHWCYFGAINSFNTDADDIQALTAPVTAGTAQTFTVGSTTSLAAGDYVTVWEHTSGTTERVQITSISGATTFVATCAYNHNVGALVAIDPAPMVVAGDTYSAVAPISALGYRAGYDADGYILRPAFNPTSDSRVFEQLGPLQDSGVNTRGSVIAHPFILCSPLVPGNTSSTSNFANHPTPTLEPKGTLPKVFSVRQPTGAISEDTLRIRGKTFVIFAPYQHKTGTAVRPVFIALGPID